MPDRARHVPRRILPTPVRRHLPQSEFVVSLQGRLLYFVAFPIGALTTATYFLQPIRDAVTEYVPEAFLWPVGLVMFFCFGAAVGVFGGFLFVPEAILNEPGTRSELKEALGVSGARIVRVFCVFALFWFLLAAFLIFDKAYG